MRRTLTCIALVAIAGCDDFDGPPPKLQRSASVITIAVDPQLTPPGWAEWKGGICHITLREYPACLGHEVRHCFEGDWHAGYRTGEDC